MVRQLGALTKVDNKSLHLLSFRSYAGCDSEGTRIRIVCRYELKVHMWAYMTH